MSIAKDLTPAAAEQVIFQGFKDLGFPDQFSKLLTAQSGHETGGWQSPVWFNNNNGFGFGYDGKGNYFAYPSVEANIQALGAYIQGKIDDGLFPDPSTIVDPGQWAALLKAAGYYGDTTSNYTAGIIRFFNANLTGIVVISSSLLIFGLLLLLLASGKA